MAVSMAPQKRGLWRTLFCVGLEVRSITQNRKASCDTPVLLKHHLCQSDEGDEDRVQREEGVIELYFAGLSLVPLVIRPLDGLRPK